MRKKLVVRFISCLLLGLAYSNASAQVCQVSGYIKGVGNLPVVFGYEQGGKYRLDTVFATNDRFTYVAKSSDQGRIDLRISRPRYTSFFYEPGTVTVSGSIEKPDKLIIEGGPENNAFSRYKQSIEWLYEEKKRGKPDSVVALLGEQERQATLQFIKQYPANLTSAYLLYWQTIYTEKYTDVYQNLLMGLPLAVRQSAQGKLVAQRINIIRNQPIVGRKAPDLALPDTAGHAVALSTYRGKYVLLDFWGHWCGPCLKSFPKLKNLQKAYGDKLAIIGVAAEFADDKPIWLRTIRENNLNWVQLSELKADKGDVNTQYNITAFPTYILLDKDGVVIERTSRFDAIEQKITSMRGL